MNDNDSDGNDNDNDNCDGDGDGDGDGNADGGMSSGAMDIYENVATVGFHPPKE